jgi:hypothetical protein
MSAIVKFTLEVKEMRFEGAVHSLKNIVVYATSLDDAKGTYLSQTNGQDASVEAIKNVEAMTIDDVNKINIRQNFTEMIQEDFEFSDEEKSKFEQEKHAFYVSKEYKNSFIVTPKENIGADQNPFLHDSYSMGTPLVHGITAMHPGYDSKESPTPIGWIYLVNTRTGNRMSINIGKDF